MVVIIIIIISIKLGISPLYLYSCISRPSQHRRVWIWFSLECSRLHLQCYSVHYTGTLASVFVMLLLLHVVFCWSISADVASCNRLTQTANKTAWGLAQGLLGHSTHAAGVVQTSASGASSRVMARSTNPMDRISASETLTSLPVSVAPSRWELLSICC